MKNQKIKNHDLVSSDEDFFSTILAKAAEIKKSSIQETIDLFHKLTDPGVQVKFAQKISIKNFFDIGKHLVSLADDRLISTYLDIFRSSYFLSRIYDRPEWPQLILELIRVGNYNFAKMFEHRVHRYTDKILFTVLETDKQFDFSWRNIYEHVATYARGLIALEKDHSNIGKVAFLTKNSLDMALFDIACLAHGIINIMIPFNSTPAQIEYIFDKTKPQTLIISNREQLETVRRLQQAVKFPKNIIILSNSRQSEQGLFSVTQLMELAKHVDLKEVEKIKRLIKIDDLISIMFTSGTTGNPKGIMFSHQNIVFKRFARAMALPKIGEDDTFLSYLPLFHTFGRWLEMTGSIFWGARYVFMENPSPEVMIDNMQRVHPSIFISIPKKWYQLYEYIDHKVDLLSGSDEHIYQTVEEVTGGNLKWGLSAAGHLDVDVFKFFQRNGIELMSGFGMTEATGGITMTPPGNYVPNSLGKPLPGIDVKLENDGELLIKGGYVMMGYVNPEEGDTEIKEGWLPSGDIMRWDENGFLQIIDRKKEIYKNIKGETIAPQKIENYFREFEFIKHVFLVGDHKPYNTLLIYPNYEFKEVDLKVMSKQDLREYFSSVVVSVNRFLPRFERIVDFAIINRDFDSEKSELTAKGTYRRKIVEKNFARFINPMYDNNYSSYSLKNFEIHIPNWFLREKGLTADQVRIKRNCLQVQDAKQGLTIRPREDDIQIGNFAYINLGRVIDLGQFFIDPALWIGNDEIVEFTGDNIFNWYRPDDIDPQFKIVADLKKPKIDTKLFAKIKSIASKKQYSISGIHYASLLLQSKIDDESSLAINYLETIAKEKKSDIADLASSMLQRSALNTSIAVQRKIFMILTEIVADNEFEMVARSFLMRSVNFLNSEIISAIGKQGLNDAKLKCLFDITYSFSEENNDRVVPLFTLLAKYGAHHPTRYKFIRHFIVSCELGNLSSHIKKLARKYRFILRDGFREWLGITQKVAVDIETEEEYTWNDVIIYEEDTDKDDLSRLISAIKNTTLIRESIFLFSKGVLVRLTDIPPGGIWISHLGTMHGKAVYRIIVQTRYQGSFDLAVNINHSLTYDQILDEITWLVQAGTTVGGKKLVEDFGGYWKSHNLWSEEFIPGETTGKFIQRMGRQQHEEANERVSLLWPFFIWSGVSAYLHFWQRTQKKMEIVDPSPYNVIIPSHDYLAGTRIVSITKRKVHINCLDMMVNMNKCFITDIENQFQFLAGKGQYKYIFSAFMEALGEEQGLLELQKCLSLVKGKQKNHNLKSDLTKFIASVQKHGFIPKRLYFAIKRYKRWLALNQTATIQARATTLAEIYETYDLPKLETQFPESRTRFFASTVFENTQDELKKGLQRIIIDQRQGKLNFDQMTQFISVLQKKLDLNKEELFFLARLTYPHLSPTDSADLVSLDTGGVVQADLIVRMQDYDGNFFRVRMPINPKEITRLQQLFVRNNLLVQFRPDHRFLIAVNERSQLIGGLFYKRIDNKIVHIEKIVVEGSFRKKGVSDGILKEFFKRMHADHYEYVTTGFFRPEYFYRFGFKVERKYAGLVKNLRQK